MLFGVVLLLVSILGFIDPGTLMHTLINSGGSGDPDNFLHLVTGALGVYFGSGGGRARTNGNSHRLTERKGPAGRYRRALSHFVCQPNNT